jgi:opacity protein-like surface antigen
LGLVSVGITGIAQMAFAQSPPPIPVPDIYAAGAPAPGSPASIVLPQRASAQNPWYIEGSAGAVWRMDASRSTTFFTTTPGPGFGAGLSGPGTETATFDVGYNLNLGVGYRLPMGFRMEVEGGYVHYTAASLSPKSTDGTFPALNGSQLNVTSGGGHDQYAVTLNAFYDIPVSSWCVPFVGVGGGVNFTQQEDAHFAGPGRRAAVYAIRRQFDRWRCARRGRSSYCDGRKMVGGSVLSI